jgi:FkbM family methyltransferase
MNSANTIYIPPNINHICIDVGLSHTPPYTIHWLSNYTDCFVFGFEPVEENCTRVLEKIKSLGFDNRFKLFQCAVDNVERAQFKNFYVTCNSEVKGDHGQSSLYKLRNEDKVKESMWIEKTTPTICINLADFLAKIDWNRFPMISCLKTDTQGNDLNILKSIHQYLGKIKHIQCESYVHNLYEKDEDNPQLVYDFMTSNGYKLIDGNIMGDEHIYELCV